MFLYVNIKKMMKREIHERQKQRATASKNKQGSKVLKPGVW